MQQAASHKKYIFSPVQSAPWLEQLQFQGQHTSAIKRRNQISNLCEPLAMQLFEEEENQTHRKLELGRFKWRGNWPLGWGWHPLDGDTRSNQPEIYFVAICKVTSSKPWRRVARRGQPSPWQCWSARPEKIVAVFLVKGKVKMSNVCSDSELQSAPCQETVLSW